MRLTKVGMVACVIMICFFFSGCAIRFKSGNVLYIGGSTQELIITNNMGYSGDVFRNGHYVVTISTGQTQNIGFGGASPNTSFMFKAFVQEPGGKRYIGFAERTVSQSSYAYNKETWVISYVQQVQRY